MYFASDFTSSRAIHLELFHDIKAPAFFRAFKRFIAKSGMPDIVISDNFKTFKREIYDAQ